MDLGGHDFDVGGGDMGDFGGAGAHFSPLSPTLISFFLTVFGGVGGVGMSLWHIEFRYALLIALVTALGSATIVYLVLCKVFEATQGGVEVNVAELVGHEGEVITGIPKNGMGEIALITAGGRINGPARSADGKAIALNTTVRIVKIVGGTYIVRKSGEADVVTGDRPGQAAADSPNPRSEG
jgi:membrane-bound ClpP family serine protease